jgi:hypothetical protein
MVQRVRRKIVVQQLQYPMHLPVTPQTDPRNYPGGGKIPEQEFAEFPKVIVIKCDDAYLEAWKQRHGNMNSQTGKMEYSGSRPQKDAPVPVLDDQGQPIIVNSKDEEIAVRGRLGLGPPPRLGRIIEVEVDETERLERKKLHDENAALKAQLDAIKTQLDAMKTGSAPNPHKSHKGWPKGVKRGSRKLAPAVRPPAAERVAG